MKTTSKTVQPFFKLLSSLKHTKFIDHIKVFNIHFLGFPR